MIYVIENNELKVQINSFGAEMVSVVSNASGSECIWEGDPKVWGRHAPILFPYTGKLPEGKMLAKGGIYEGGQHGFARDMEHDMVECSGDRIVFELRSDDVTKAKFPFDFVLRSVYSLDGNTVNHTLEVDNPSDTEDMLQFGIGYHPAFVCPFDSEHDTEDYEFRFDRKESPLVIDTQPAGLMSGKSYYLGMNTESIQLTDRLFDDDSKCMANLRSKTLGIYEKGTGRSVVCNIEGFPYCLIWSAITEKIKFVCIEPWHSVTAPEGASIDWNEREHGAHLNPGESFKTTLSMTFNR